MFPPLYDLMVCISLNALLYNYEKFQFLESQFAYFWRCCGDTKQNFMWMLWGINERCRSSFFRPKKTLKGKCCIWLSVFLYTYFFQVSTITHNTYTRGHNYEFPYVKRKPEINRYENNEHFGSSLVIRWLRICLPMQGTWVQSLVREVRSHIPRSN